MKMARCVTRYLRLLLLLGPELSEMDWTVVPPHCAPSAGLVCGEYCYRKEAAEAGAGSGPPSRFCHNTESCLRCGPLSLHLHNEKIGLDVL